MTKIISIANQKGGVGKTVTAVNLSSFLSILGKKTLLIDMDPQGHSGIGLGLNIDDPEYKTTYHLLMNKDITVDDCITEVEFEDGSHMDIIISNTHLSYAERELEKVYRSPLQILKKKLKSVIDSSSYDFIIIDCPPSLGNLAMNAFLPSNLVIIPISTSFFSLQGMEKIVRTLKDVMEELEIEFDIFGLLTRFRKNQNVSHQVEMTVKNYFKDHLLKTAIRENIDIEKAIGEGMPICEYSKSSNGFIDYKRLAMEIINYGNN
ncbi:ParA family protein [bacterium]|nr:ParA family protein [bacterium]